MTSQFVPCELPTTLMSHDQEYVTFNQNPQHQTVGHNLNSYGTIISPYTVAFRKNQYQIEIWSLLNYQIRTILSEDEEILDFAFQQIKNKRDISNFETIAIINSKGQIKTYDLGLEDDKIHFSLIDSIFSLVQPNQKLKLFYAKSSFIYFVQSNQITIIQKQISEDQVTWVQFEKQCSQIIDIQWSRQLRLLFVVHESQQIVIYNSKNLDLIQEIQLSNYYEQKNEYVIQIALFENNQTQPKEISNQIDIPYNFITLSNHGELTIWSMQNYDTGKKLYMKLESLNLNCKSEYMNSSIFFNGNNNIKMEINKLGHIIFISGVYQDNCSGENFFYIVKLAFLQKLLKIVQTLINQAFRMFKYIYVIIQPTRYFIIVVSMTTNITLILIYNLIDKVLSEIQKNIKVILYYNLVSQHLSDPQSQAYLLITFHKESIRFHWVFREYLWNTQQTFQQTNDYKINNGELYELIRSKQLANSHLPSIPQPLQIELIKTQEKELQQDTKLNLYENSGLQMKSDIQEYPKENQIDKKFMQMLIKDIAEDQLFLQLVSQNLDLDSIQLDYNNEKFKSQILTSYSTQFTQIEQQLEHTLTSHLHMTTQYCENILSEFFSHDQITSLVNQTFDELIVFGSETQNLIHLQTQHYYETQILPLYKSELLSLSLNVTQMLNRTTQLFKETETQDVIKLKSLREFLLEIKDHLNNLVCAVNKLNIKQYNEIQQDLVKMWQKMNDTQNQLEVWLNKNSSPIVHPSSNPAQIQQNIISQNIRQDQGISTNVMSTMNQLSLLQQQLTSSNAINVKTLHQILSQLIAQLQIYLISCER